MAEQAPRIRLRGVFLRRTDWTGADLSGADLSGSDVSNAVFGDADFRDAKLDGTILHGVDLSRARNLTLDQLTGAVIDGTTKLPAYIETQRSVREPAE